MVKPKVVIDGPFRRDCREALVCAYDSLGRFRTLVTKSLGVSLKEITPAQDLSEAAFEVILWAVESRRLQSLITAAAAGKPHSRNLRRLAGELAAGFAERVIREEIPFEPAENWIRKLADARRAVCRIEPQEKTTNGYGTGFLVGPDVVMTNHHVVKDFSQTPIQGPSSVRLRFDYEYGRDGVSVKKGKTYKLAKDWLLFQSPEKQLDFALVRLDGRPGEEVLAGKTPRGWLRPIDHTFAIDEPLFILQHADALPLTLSPGTVTNREDGQWVRYNVNTKEGSSGSPCLTFGLEVAAIHHWGFSSYNRGVRYSAIHAELKAARRKLPADVCELFGLG